MYTLAEWIKKLLISALIFHISRGPDFLSHFLSITILRRLSIIYVSGRQQSSENLNRPRSCCFMGDSIPGSACWHFTQCSLHTIMLLSLPLALTRMPTSAPSCCIHVAFWQFRPHVTLWSKAAATFQQLTIVFSFDHDSWFLSKVQKTRAALNSQS